MDPCLFLRENELGTVIIGLYVDDLLCMGDKEAVDDALTALGKEFKIKVVESMRFSLS